MSTPILATKLYIPASRPNIVGRPDILQRLNDNLHSKLTLISAPAGFGKTTLVSEWLTKCLRPAAWLSLDERDNDLNQFLAYLVAALQTLSQNKIAEMQPDFGKAVLALLQSPPPVPTQPVLTTLLNEIAAIPDAFILVLDDYHLINAVAVDEVLDFLVNHLPPQMHLVIVTREDPPLPLARLRVRGQLSELRAKDLRFTITETAVFLTEAMALNLSTRDIAALEDRTEGWIAGLQLAALALQGGQRQQDTAVFIESFTGSHRFVLDYLVEEVLQQQPQNIRSFLLQTSILDRLCGPLCDAVLGVEATAAQTRLEYLDRANLLVVPLDDMRQWYRYHHLFADVLRTRLRQEQPDLLAILHRRACDWYVQNGLPSDAIQHALAAAEFTKAADLIELSWSDVRRSCFQSPTWLAWVQALPEEQVYIRPVLCVGYAWELLNFGELQAATVPISHAERLLESKRDTNKLPAEETAAMVVVNKAEFSSLPATLATAKGLYAQALGDTSATIRHAQQALALVLEGDFYARGIAAMLLGFAKWAEGALGIAFQTLTASMESMQKAGNTLYAISVTSALADIRLTQGRLHDAINVYQRGLQMAAVQGEAILQGTADLYLGLAELYHEQGERELAQQNLHTSQELGATVALPHWPYRLCQVQAKMAEGAGAFDAALTYLTEAERVYYGVPIPIVRPISALRARVWLRMGRLERAWEWVQDQGLAVEDDLSLLNEFAHIVLARVFVAQYQQDNEAQTIQKALGLLERLLATAVAAGKKHSVIEILIVQALAYQAQRNIRAARASLAQALKLGEPEGYVRIFVDEGAPLAELMATMQQGVNSGYVTKLLRIFETDAQKQNAKSHPNLSQSANDSLLLEPLTPREQEVLHLLVAGHSNPEIADQLFIAVTTVKTHVKNIYGKLQVKNRLQAVARAKELHLS